MLRKVIAVGIVFALGYSIGAISGFRAAVIDYVEGDAKKLERMADSIYDDEMPDGLEEAVEQELYGDSESDSEPNESGATAFQ